MLADEIFLRETGSEQTWPIQEIPDSRVQLHFGLTIGWNHRRIEFYKIPQEDEPDVPKDTRGPPPQKPRSKYYTAESEALAWEQSWDWIWI